MHQKIAAIGVALIVSLTAVFDSPAFSMGRSLDVPYVPTPQHVVDEMLKMARIDQQDVLYDLGSGDGRIVITAAKQYGAHGIGIDLSPKRIRESRDNAEAAGVTRLVRFIEGDLFEADLSDATAVTLYLYRSVNLELRPKLLRELRPGTPIVSHAHDMAEWEPDQTVDLGGYRIYRWTVPAQVAGRWRFAIDGRTNLPAELTLKQDLQKVSGTALINGVRAQLEGGFVRGDQLEFAIRLMSNGTIQTQQFRGRVNGSQIEGHVISGEVNRAGANPRWTATQIYKAPQNNRQSIGMDAVPW